MPIIHFYAWINRTDPTDPGHLVMYDLQTHHTLEIQQVPLGKEEVYERYAAVGPSSITMTDRRSGRAYTARVSPIRLLEQPLRVYVDAQRRRTWKQQGIRFTHVYKIAVQVTEAELQEMRFRMALALGGGNYNLFREARAFDPTAGRCLLPIEVLASARGQNNLQGQNAFEYVRSFMQWCRNSCFGEDGADLGDEAAVRRLFRLG